MPKIDDGGPAFPSIYGATEALDEGMSLRDYFAIHCDQPGEAEILTEAGIVVDDKGGFEIDGKKTYFGMWWRTVPQDDRFRFYSAVRYKMADAMLKARHAGDHS